MQILLIWYVIFKRTHICDMTKFLLSVENKTAKTIKYWFNNGIIVSSFTLSR